MKSRHNHRAVSLQYSKLLFIEIKRPSLSESICKTVYKAAVFLIQDAVNTLISNIFYVCNAVVYLYFPWLYFFKAPTTNSISMIASHIHPDLHLCAQRCSMELCKYPLTYSLSICLYGKPDTQEDTSQSSRRASVHSTFIIRLGQGHRDPLRISWRVLIVQVGDFSSWKGTIDNDIATLLYIATQLFFSR